MRDVPFTRRTVLAGTLAVACSTLTGCTAPRPSTPGPPDSKEEDIFDLSFQITTRYRPFELVAEAFVAVTEGFRGELTGVVVSEESPRAPFCAVELTVTAADGTVVAGLAGAEDEHLFAFYDPRVGRAGIEVRVDGRTTVVAETSAQLPEGFRLSFVLCENRVTVLADTGDGWQALLTERSAVAALVDMRAPETLARHRYAWGARPGSGEVQVSGGRAGLFGMAGIRDQHLVQHADGSPYVRDGKVYLTATCAGLGFFQQAHWAVFTMDLAQPDRLEHVGQLFFSRDGLVLGDHAGQIVLDDDGRWVVATSSWGDFAYAGVHVRHVETDVDVLHGVHVLETERTPLPTEMSAWDPGLTKIDDRWYISFVESPSQDPFDFHPALAAARPSGRWTDDLELIGAATDLHQCEGPVMAQVEGRWWLLASDGDQRVYPVFDLDMKRYGELDAPYETNIPHPQLVERDEGGFWLVTFDGTQFAEDTLGYGTHGDVLLMRTGAHG